MSKCQMNKYRAGGRCGGGSAQPGRDTETPSVQAMGGALANLMAARDMQDRSFAPPAKPAKQEALVAPSRPEKKECIDIILEGDF